MAPFSKAAYCKGRIYLLLLAANRPIFPLLPAEVHQLLSNPLVWLMGQSVIRTRQLTAKEGLLPTVASDSTPAGLMDFRLGCKGETDTAEGRQRSDERGGPHHRSPRSRSARREERKAASQPPS